MRREVPDSELARLFHEERRDAEAAAPEPGALLARPRRRRPAGARLVRRAALAAARAVIAAALLLRTRSFRGHAPQAAGLPPAARQLAAWRAPTDVLLRTPGSDLWTRVPVLAPRSSVPEPGIFLEATKGVER
jgi:hypothetical protein